MYFYSTFISETEKFKEEVPSCVISKAGDDNYWVNPSCSGQFKLINGNIPTTLTTGIDRKKFVYELEIWYNKKNNTFLNKVLTYAYKNKGYLSEYIVPIN